MKEEERTLAKKSRDAQVLEKRRRQVAAEASAVRNKIAAKEKAEADAVRAAREAKEAAEQAVRDEQARAERARAKVAQERAAAEEMRKQLEGLIAVAKEQAKRFTIGQRVRCNQNAGPKYDGQVGTVNNIKIEGATGLRTDDRPGVRVLLDAGGNIFLDPSAVTPFDYGTKTVAPRPLAQAYTLDKWGLRPLDGKVARNGLMSTTFRAGKTLRPSTSVDYTQYPDLNTLACNRGLGPRSGPLSPKRRRSSVQNRPLLTRQEPAKQQRGVVSGLRLSASMGALESFR
eukprot:SAG31_NODE_1819_length_7201_cov_9.661504_5_plen_286_part_00